MKKIIVAMGLFALFLSKAQAQEKTLQPPDLTAAAEKALVCSACHGQKGISPSGDWPNLAGQNEGYLLKQLRDFKSGARQDVVMSAQVALLEEQDLVNLAAYFAQMPAIDNAVAQGAGDTPEEMLALGEALYRGGDKERNIPACAACHGPAGAGIAPALFPRVAGQPWQYSRKQMQNFHNAALINEQASDFQVNPNTIRANDPNEVMRDVMAKLTPKQIEALAHYMQGLR